MKNWPLNFISIARLYGRSPTSMYNLWKHHLFIKILPLRIGKKKTPNAVWFLMCWPVHGRSLQNDVFIMLWLKWTVRNYVHALLITWFSCQFVRDHRTKCPVCIFQYQHERHTKYASNYFIQNSRLRSTCALVSQVWYAFIIYVRYFRNFQNRWW